MEVSGRRIAVFVIGVFLLVAGLRAAIWMGEKWLIGEGANADWWMNTYFCVTGQTAYIWFAIVPWVLSGIIAAITVQLMFNHPKFAVPPLIASVFLGSLGFNTFDWQISYMAGNGGESNFYQMWPLGLSGMLIEGWNFYLCCVLIPLWFGAFLTTLAIINWIIENRK
jgi:hypothetical protein